ncbi:MAG: amidohydrolase [Planctomycetes bacterium]|nr:amidohydrolase [Planctomycetota bacterium]
MNIIKFAVALVLVLPHITFGDSVRTTHSASDASSVAKWLDQNIQDLLKTYKHLHANPELSLQEVKTAALLAESFKRDGYEVTTGVGGTGVVAVMTNGDGPTVLIRGDMDALPIIEETGLDYISKVRVSKDDGTKVGVMHACGHDVHSTMLMGTARLLSELRTQWRGRIILVAQPAEEIGQGARMMIEDGLFERFPKPDFCIALHVQHNLPVGHIGYTSGWAFANVDSVDITVFGRGGHGARPNMAVDPIVAAAHLITSLQTIVSRRLDPLERAVITVGSIHGGSKHNIIPNEVKLQLTVRSYTDEVRKQLEIYDDMKDKYPKYIHGKCPIHQGDNRTGFSWDYEKGIFKCWTRGCHSAGNDVYGLVEQLLELSFTQSVQWVIDTLEIDINNATPLSLSESTREQVVRDYFQEQQEESLQKESNK